MQLSILQLPRLVTVNHGTRRAGWFYTRRNFKLYIMIFCIRGSIHITEGEDKFSLDAGEMIVLNPAEDHFGHQATDSETEYYYVYFQHSPVIQYWEIDQIPWKTVIHRKRKGAIDPSEDQYMFLPKTAKMDTYPTVQLLDQMVELHRHFSLENCLKLQSLFVQLLSLIQSLTKTRNSSRSMDICGSVKRYLQENYMLTVKANDLEEEFHYHYDYLSRSLKQHVGMTPMQYLNFLRINEAAHLLLHTDTSLTDIAERVGIRDYNYFSRLFRQAIGMSPSEYRNKL